MIALRFLLEYTELKKNCQQVLQNVRFEQNHFNAERAHECVFVGYFFFGKNTSLVYPTKVFYLFHTIIY